MIRAHVEHVTAHPDQFKGRAAEAAGETVASLAEQEDPEMLVPDVRFGLFLRGQGDEIQDFPRLVHTRMGCVSSRPAA